MLAKAEGPRRRVYVARGPEGLLTAVRGSGLTEIVEGAGAREWLNVMLTNNIDKLGAGIGQYTFLLNERSGIIDDLIVYRIEEETFLLVVNAALIEHDLAHRGRAQPHFVDMVTGT